MTDEGDTGSPGRLELAGPADLEVIDLVHAMFENLWTTHPDVADEDRARFEMAVIEILGNIVEHAYAMDSGSERTGERRFEISLQTSATELVATLSDNGKPMPIDLGDITMPDDLAETGRGLALAAGLLDDLDYERVEGRNRWRLLCRRRPA